MLRPLLMWSLLTKAWNDSTTNTPRLVYLAIYVSQNLTSIKVAQESLIRGLSVKMK